MFEMDRADEILKEIKELKEQVGLNCSKLDNMQNQMNDFYTAFGREISKIQVELGVEPFTK